MNLPIDEVLDLYINQGLSVRKVAEHFGCTHYTISHFLKKNNVQIRSGYSKEYYVYRRKYQIGDTQKRDYVRVMEASLGRPLNQDEIVHHLDFDRENNDISNLYLFENTTLHISYHGYIRNHEYITPDEFIRRYKASCDNICSYDYLYDCYVNKCMSANAISRNNYPVSRTTVVGHLKKYGIYDLRSPTVN